MTIRCVVADTRFVFVTFPKYFHVPEVRGAITSSFVASERAKLFLGAGARQIQSVDWAACRLCRVRPWLPLSGRKLSLPHPLLIAFSATMFAPSFPSMHSHSNPKSGRRKPFIFVPVSDRLPPPPGLQSGSFLCPFAPPCVEASRGAVHFGVKDPLAQGSPTWRPPDLPAERLGERRLD